MSRLQSTSQDKSQPRILHFEIRMEFAEMRPTFIFSGVEVPITLTSRTMEDGVQRVYREVDRTLGTESWRDIAFQVKL